MGIDEIKSNFVHIVFDAFKPSLERDILGVFSKELKEGQKVAEILDRIYTPLGLVYDESAIKDRKAKCRGFANLMQLEGVHVVSREPFSEKKT